MGRFPEEEPASRDLKERPVRGRRRTKMAWGPEAGSSACLSFVILLCILALNDSMALTRPLSWWFPVPPWTKEEAGGVSLLLTAFSVPA